MDLLLLVVVLLALVLVLLAVVLVVLLKRRRQTAAERLELGMSYARLGIAYAASLGHPPGSDRWLVSAAHGFRLADETSDGKRDFTDQQARVLLEAAAKG